MVRPPPSVMTQGENARLTCQVPRTNDFFMGSTFLGLDGNCAKPDPSPQGDGAKAAGQQTHPALAPWITRHNRSGVAGISTWRTLGWETASPSELATAGIAPTQPASPAPLTPSGLVLVGTGLLLTSTALMSVARLHPAALDHPVR